MVTDTNKRRISFTTKPFMAISTAAILMLSSTTFTVGTLSLGAGVALTVASPTAMADGIDNKEAKELGKLMRKLKRLQKKLGKLEGKSADTMAEFDDTIAAASLIICGVAECP